MGENSHWTSSRSLFEMAEPSGFVALQVYSPDVFLTTPWMTRLWLDMITPASMLWCSSLP